MSPESQQPHSEDAKAELAFVTSPRSRGQVRTLSRIIVAVLALLAVVVFIWMHHQMFPPETLAGLLHSLLRVDLFFMVLLFAITMYLRQVMNETHARSFGRSPTPASADLIADKRRAAEARLHFMLLNHARRLNSVGPICRSRRLQPMRSLRITPFMWTNSRHVVHLPARATLGSTFQVRGFSARWIGDTADRQQKSKQVRPAGESASVAMIRKHCVWSAA